MVIQAKGLRAPVTSYNVSRCVLRCVLVATALGVAAPAVAVEKLPVPSEAAKEQALDLVKQVYGDEWENAKTHEEKQALAERLFEKADQAAEEENRYVLLEVARNLAAQSGDADLAYRIIDATAARYDIDVYRLRGAALSEAARSAISQEARSTAARLSLQLIDEAVERDDFEAARYLGGLAAEAARKARNFPLARQIIDRNKEVEDVAQAYAAIQDALATLKSNPVDPQANLAVGKYRCFFKGDWDRGLSMLALGSDEALKTLALKELGDELDADGQVALGDQWWELATSGEAAAQSQLQEHAAVWYRKALPALSGLLRDKVKKRLDSLDVKEATLERGDGWISIFDGRSLQGWKADQNPRSWSVVDGVLVGRGRVGQRSFLYYNRRLADFEATAEIKINATGNSGFYFRSTSSVDKGGRRAFGYEVQVVGGKVAEQYRTGSIHGLARSAVNLAKDDQWFKLHLVAKGNRLTVTIDDRQVVDYVDPANKFPSGFIALQLWNADTTVCFRNMRIKPLP